MVLTISVKVYKLINVTIQNTRKIYIILGVCASSPCEENTGLCLNNYECIGDLICGSDNVCSKPCSVTACDLGEGNCYDNTECKGSLICSSNMTCRGTTPKILFEYVSKFILLSWMWHWIMW